MYPFVFVVTVSCFTVRYKGRAEQTERWSNTLINGVWAAVSKFEGGTSSYKRRLNIQGHKQLMSWRIIFICVLIKALHNARYISQTLRDKNMNNTRWPLARMSYGANTPISRVITRATQIANAARRYFALTVLAAAVSACNQSNHDTTPPSIINIVPVKISDTTKPVLNISNASLVMGVILPNNATPSSFVIAPKGRITATDNNGTATLSVRNVVGLSAEQVQLAADGTLSAINTNLQK